MKYKCFYSIGVKKYEKNTGTITLNKLPIGIIKVTLYVKDSKGRDGTVDQVLKIKSRPITGKELTNKNSKEPNQEKRQPPLSVNIEGPLSVKTTEGQIILSPILTSEDKKILKYYWSQETGPSSDYEINENHQLILKARKTGYYTFKLKIEDESNKVYETSHTLKIIEALKPSVQVPFGNYTIQFPTDAITITALASDIDGFISSYLWTQVGGSPVQIQDPNSKILNLIQLKEGQYSFKVAVIDNDGLTGEAFVSVNVIDPATSTRASTSSGGVTPPSKDIQRSNGGPGNAFVNLLVPGLGHYYVSGDFNGENKKKASFIITLIYIGAATGAIYYKLKSKNEYSKYLDMASYREFQYGPSGTITGIRGALASSADQSYNLSNDYNKTATSFLIAGGSILASDFIYTLIKGVKNRNDYKRSIGFTNFNLTPIPGTKQFTASVVFGF